MYLKFFIALTLFSQPAWSQSPIIGLGNTNYRSEFKEHVNSNAKVSLTDALIKKKVADTNAKIKSKYELAVKGLLMSDLKPSIYLFKELTSLSTSSIFTDEASQLISESHFRLANLERASSDFWIKRGLYFDLEFRPSDEIFNPVIIKSYKKKRNEILNYSFNFNLKRITPSESRVFFSGIELVADDVTIHPSGEYGLHVFKDGYIPQHKVFEGEQISKLKRISMEKIDFGTCKNPKFKKVEGLLVHEIFFSPNCISKRDQIKSNNKEFNLAKKSILVAPAKIEEVSASKRKKKLNRNTWYAVAGAVVATSLIIALSNSGGGGVKVEPVDQ